MEKRMYEITYVSDGEDTIAYHERHIVPNADIAETFNTLIIKFNQTHPANYRVESIHEITAEGVKSALEDMLKDWRNGTLYFSADDAQYVQYAIDLLGDNSDD